MHFSLSLSVYAMLFAMSASELDKLKYMHVSITDLLYIYIYTYRKYVLIGQGCLFRSVGKLID